MPATIRPLKQLTAREQVHYFHTRTRRMSLNNISKGLFRTLFLPLAPGNHSSTLWPTAVRSRPYTIMAEIQIDGAAAEGVIVEIGSTAHGMGITMDSGILYAFAGSNGADGVDVTFTPAVGRRLWVAIAMSPQNGTIAMYIDGKLQVKDTSSGGGFTDDEWAAPSTGAGIGQVNTTHNDRVALVDTLSNVSMVSPVSFFAGQVPRGFLA